jgi:hypothetical protein
VRWRRGVARAAAVVEQAVRAAHPEPQATQAAREAVRAATALLNRPAAKAVQLAILLLNRPAVRAKTVLIPQGRELGLVPRQGACADTETNSAARRFEECLHGGVFGLDGRPVGLEHRRRPSCAEVDNTPSATTCGALAIYAPSKPHVFRMPHLSWTRNNPHPHSRSRTPANRALHPLPRNRRPQARRFPGPCAIRLCGPIIATPIPSKNGSISGRTRTPASAAVKACLRCCRHVGPP